jgi:adenine-specific DNA-methyltransferase
MWYPIPAPDGSEILPVKPDGTEGRWRWKRENVTERASELEFIRVADRWEIYVKQYAEEDSTRPPSTIWLDSEVGHNHEAKLEAKALAPSDPFPTPKPERLLRRVLSLATEPGEIVLDSFAGSGTTGAVAQKMGRRWIMVELGEHAKTHIVPRMKKVIDGTDPGGITEAVEWKGGGGFRYFKLAPSLIEKDKWGNPVINKGYNADMLAEAVCKLEGFTYAPTDVYWQQGYSTERDFIYVTTQKLTREQLQTLSDEVGDDQTLLVCCAAFRAKPDAFANLTIKKIPHAVLSRCEWGRDDYSLQIKNLPAAPDLGVVDDEPPAKPAKGKAKKTAAEDSLSLFNTARTK